MGVREKVRKRLAENQFKAKLALKNEDIENAAEFLLRSDEDALILKLLK